MLLPFVCVYYPLSTLPGWLHPFALALPPTYVFEGLRALVQDGVFRSGDMLMALNRPAEAMAEYRATLMKEPNRRHALRGVRKGR